MPHIKVVNFKKYQRYKERRPPWVKLYRSILDDPDFEALSDTAFRLAIGLLLLASEFENEIPYRLHWVKKRCGLGAKKRAIRSYLDDLLEIGFVAVIDDPEEKRVQSAPVETETESTTVVPSKEATTSVLPSVPSGEGLTEQQLRVKRVEDVFLEAGYEKPPAKWIASWLKRWGDDDALLRCAKEIVADGLPPGAPAEYASKKLASALKNGKRVWRAGRASRQSASNIQSHLSEEDEWTL